MRKSVVPGSSWDTESIEILSIFYRKKGYQTHPYFLSRVTIMSKMSCESSRPNGFSQVHTS